jgi:hypothetical protein
MRGNGNNLITSSKAQRRSTHPCRRWPTVAGEQLIVPFLCSARWPRWTAGREEAAGGRRRVEPEPDSVAQLLGWRPCRTGGRRPAARLCVRGRRTRRGEVPAPVRDGEGTETGGGGGALAGIDRGEEEGGEARCRYGRVPFDYTGFSAESDSYRAGN